MALIRIDVSEERVASIIRVKRIGELGTTLAVTSSRSRLRRNALIMEAIRFSETSVPTRGTLHHIPEYGILHSHRHEHLTSYRTHLISELKKTAKSFLVE
jgi:hypothetical protein